MNEIIKDTLHPEKQNDVDIYPKTSLDQVVGYDEDKELLKQEISNTYAKKTDIENSPLKEGVGKMEKMSLPKLINRILLP